MNKITNTILAVINYIIQLVCYMYIGFKAAQLLEVYSEDSDKKIIIVLLAAVLIFTWMYVHIVLHEAGHMVAGLLTGYSFVSFRIGKYTIIKTTYGLQFKKMVVLGTAGQCLMCPPTVDPKECPYKLYHLGGGLANLILAGILIGIYTTMPLNMTSYFCLFMPAMMGFALGLSNLFPAKMGGMPNDGYNLLIDLRKDELIRKCMNIILTMNAMLTVAYDYSDLNGSLRDELMSMDFDNMDITSPSICNAYVYKAAVLYSEKKFDEAYVIYKRILDTEGVIRVFKSEAQCEVLFYKVLNNAPAEEIDALYDKDTQVYIRATSVYPSRHRLMYAYQLLYKKDNDKANDELAEVMKLLDVYAIAADVKLEFDIINDIRVANQKKL